MPIPAGSRYVALVARELGLDLHDVTFSGATTSDLLGPSAAGQAAQLNAVTPETSLVTITAGGNDVGFVPRLTLASLPWPPRVLPPVKARVESLGHTRATDQRFEQLARNLAAIAARLRDRGQASGHHTGGRRYRRLDIRRGLGRAVAALRPGISTSGGSLMMPAHQPGQDVFRSVRPEDIDWQPFPAFPPSARLAVVVGKPTAPGPYVIRVKVPSGVKLMPHRHPEDRVYTVISGVFYIGVGEQFDDGKLEAHPPGAVVVLPGGTPHFHWAKSGEYVTQVTAIGPLGLEYLDPEDDPRNA